MVKTKVFYELPDGGFVRKEKTSKTTYLQDKGGKMRGRKRVRGVGDGTGVKRVKQDFVLVKRSKTSRGHVRSLRKNYLPGQIIGRT